MPRRGEHRDHYHPTVSAEPALAKMAIEAGANAFVIKDRMGEDLLLAIDQARAGAEFVSQMD